MDKIDMNKLKLAIEYIKRMSMGNNPVNNQPILDDSVLHDDNVKRCLQYVQEILQGVESGEIHNKRKEKDTDKVRFPYDKIESFQYEKDKPLSHIAKQINDLVDTKIYKKVTYRSIKAGLIRKGYLEECVNERLERAVTNVTAEGVKLGIYRKRKVGASGKEYDVIMYNNNAQKYIVANLQELDI